MNEKQNIVENRRFINAKIGKFRKVANYLNHEVDDLTLAKNRKKFNRFETTYRKMISILITLNVIFIFYYS